MLFFLINSNPEHFYTLNKIEHNLLRMLAPKGQISALFNTGKSAVVFSSSVALKAAGSICVKYVDSLQYFS
jgi:hypothetical protein